MSGSTITLDRSLATPESANDFDTLSVGHTSGIHSGAVLPHRRRLSVVFDERSVELKGAVGNTDRSANESKPKDVRNTTSTNRTVRKRSIAAKVNTRLSISSNFFTIDENSTTTSTMNDTAKNNDRRGSISLSLDDSSGSSVSMRVRSDSISNTLGLSASMVNSRSARDTGLESINEDFAHTRISSDDLKARKKKKRNYPNVSRILPFLLTPVELPSGLKLDIRVPQSVSKLRTQDMYQKFLSGRISVQQRENGDLVVGPGGSPFAPQKTWKRINNKELASFRTTNVKFYRKYIKTEQQKIENTEKKRRMDFLRLDLVARLDEVTDWRNRTEAAEAEHKRLRAEHEVVTKGINAKISDLLKAIETLDEEIVRAKDARRNERAGLKRSLMNLAKECRMKEAGFEQKLGEREKELQDVMNELRELKDFRLKVNANPEAVLANIKDLQEKKVQLRQKYEQQMKDLQKKAENDQLEAEGTVMAQLIHSVENANDKLSEYLDSNLIPAHHQGLRLKREIELQKQHIDVIKEDIKNLEQEQKRLLQKRAENVDVRRAVLNKKRTE